MQDSPPPPAPPFFYTGISPSAKSRHPRNRLQNHLCDRSSLRGVFTLSLGTSAYNRKSRDLPVQVAADLREHMEIVHTSEYPRFINSLLKCFVQLLKNKLQPQVRIESGRGVRGKGTFYLLFFTYSVLDHALMSLECCNPSNRRLGFAETPLLLSTPGEVGWVLRP